MSGCDSFSAAVLEGTKPPGLAEHLAGCAACRGLRQAHAEALTFDGVELPPPPRMPVGRVVGRLALVGAVVGLIAFALVPEPEPVVAQRPSTSVGELGLSAPEPAPSLEALADLHHTVTRYARVDPTAHGYGPRFGSLPLLFAPSPTAEESR